MAIDFKEFEKMNAPNAKNKIFEFLKKEKDKAFEYKELARLLNESERTVNAYLSILKNEGKVSHKQPYWTYNRNYSEELSLASEEVGPKVVPSMFRYEGNGIFVFINNSKIKLNLYGSIRSVKTELNQHGLVSQNIVGFYYLLRKKAGLLNKRVYKTESISNSDSEARIKLIDTCFKYGPITISAKNRHLFPRDKHPFFLEIDGKLKTKHVASMKIYMKDFFDRHSELEGKEYMTIKIVKPFEEYKLTY